METAEKVLPSVEAEQERDMRKTLASVSVFMLLTGIPLFMTDKYFNITISKFLYFAIISAMTFALSYTFRPENELKAANTSNRAMDIAVGGFLISSVISTLFSPYIGDAFLGSSGRCMGLCFVLVVAGLYRTLSRHYEIKKAELYGYMGAFAVVAFIAFLQFFGVNVFGLYNNISEATKEAYYSTIGNINVVSSYICLCLPFIMFAFCSVRGSVKRLLLFALCFCGFCFMVIVNSDSGYIGMLAAFCGTAYLISKKASDFYKLPLLVSAFLFSLRFVKLLSLGTLWKTKELSPLAVMLGESDTVLILATVSAAVALLFAFVKPAQRLMSLVRVSAVAVPLLCLALFVAAMLYFTFKDTQTDLGMLERYLRFNDKWATGRGHIWRMTMESFADMPFLRKLIGCGPDTLLLLLSEKYEAEMLRSGALTDNAHNEFMNYLVNNGIIGLCFYIGIIVSSLRSCVKRLDGCWIYGGLFAAVLSYACQSVVNITQPLTTPFFFILMFMCCCDAATKRKKLPQEEN
ncbi:MAG: O-antigen ligase family protein [Clostridia bacterium]|nr:O-antigen ligase family protein [Clostridia bacterium]